MRRGIIGKSKGCVLPSGIVEDGLTILYDVSIPCSYTLGSSFINDLAGSGLNISSFANATYDSGYGGSLYFSNNGWGGFANGMSSYNVQNNFTFEFWAKPNATHQIDVYGSRYGGTTGQKYILHPGYPPTYYGYNIATIAALGVSLGTNGVTVYEYTYDWMPPIAIYSGAISTTNFSHIGISVVNKQPLIYVNGSLVLTGQTSTKNVEPHLHPTTRLFGADYGYFSGYFASFSYYNRSLNSTEISQNFNAIKSRFGL